MKAYRWLPYPPHKGFFFLPEEDNQWYYNQTRFFGFDKPNPMPRGLAEYETTDYPATGHLCRFNAEKGEFEHRIGFDTDDVDEEHPYGKWIWGKPAWRQ